MSDRLEVIYCVQHTCGETLWLSDHRIHDEEGVALLRSWATSTEKGVLHQLSAESCTGWPFPHWVQGDVCALVSDV
jgi:hypothetical protein